MDLTSMLECPVCLEEMRPPLKIFQCCNGHTLCESCRNNPSVTSCPSCRVSMTSASRNIFAEGIAEKHFKENTQTADARVETRSRNESFLKELSRSLEQRMKIVENPLKFNHQTGRFISLSQENKIASKVTPNKNYNNGLVFSAAPLQENQMFEVRIDKKISNWTGSLKIGIIQRLPNIIPETSYQLKSGSWLLMENKIVENGHRNKSSGFSLDELQEGDMVGLMKADQDVSYFVNGEKKGVLADRIANHVYAVVDIYGRCAQVSIVTPEEAVDQVSPMWECQYCTFQNSEENSLCCEVCGGARTAAEVPSQGFTCDVCTFYNESSERNVCQMCQNPR